MVKKGSYVVVFTVRSRFEVEIGAAGSYEFGLGEYAYVGSARGPGGIDSRVSRHKKTAKGENDTVQWHIDYILSSDGVDFSAAFYSEDLEECKLADLLSSRCRRIGSFGSSDCSCESHLFMGNAVGACLGAGLERFDGSE